MNIARALTEHRAGLRYHRARLWMPVNRAAFAHIGRGTVIVAPLTLHGVHRITLGEHIIVREGAWLATEEETSALSVGDGTSLGHRCHLHSIDPVSIGRGCVIAANVMITSTDHDRQVPSGVHGTGPIAIGDNVFIGQNAVVLGGVRIGDGATVAAGAVVTRDVPAAAVAAGVPARVLTRSGVNT